MVYIIMLYAQNHKNLIFISGNYRYIVVYYLFYNNCRVQGKIIILSFDFGQL